MKSDIHPTYYKDAKVTCACGASFAIGSTLPEIKVEICSRCHPFFTGEMKLIDTQGRIERFQARKKQAQALASTTKKKERQRKQRAQAKSLKEMLQKPPA